MEQRSLSNPMNSFKDIAYQILKEAGKPLRRSDVTPLSPLNLRGGCRTRENAGMAEDRRKRPETTNIRKIKP